MKTKRICILGLGIALWIVFAAILKLPLVGHINTDLAYIIFGVYCVLFGWQASIVGIIGCMFESLIFSSWFPIGWMAGNAFIGLFAGIIFKKFKINNILAVLIVAFSVFVGIGLIKTVIECSLYQIPFAIKFAKDMVATVADAIPMYFGVVIGNVLKKKEYGILKYII